MNIIMQEYKREKTNVYKALDEGIYDAVINDANIKTSRAGNKMLVIELEIKGETKMYNGAHLDGRKERMYIMLNDKFSGVKMYSLLKGCGVDVREGDEINVEQLICSSVLNNKSVRVKLSKSSYINKDKIETECNKVDYLLKSDKNSASHNELNDDDIPF